MMTRTVAPPQICSRCSRRGTEHRTGCTRCGESEKHLSTEIGWIRKCIDDLLYECEGIHRPQRSTPDMMSMEYAETCNTSDTLYVLSNYEQSSFQHYSEIVLLQVSPHYRELPAVLQHGYNRLFVIFQHTQVSRKDGGSTIAWK